MVTTKKLPRKSFSYLVPVQFSETAAPDGAAAAKEQRFHMVANSGQPMNHWYYGVLAIDMAGMSVREPVPILLSHNTSLRVGFSDQVEKTKNGLEISGKLLSGTEERDQLIADAKAGFPFQASVWAAPRVIEEVQAGAKAKVNGYELSGPATIFRQSVLRESSFCVLGVDDQTSSSVLADGMAPTGEAEVQLVESETMTTKPAAEAAAAPQPEQGKTPPAPATNTEAALAERTRVDKILKAAIPAQFSLAQKLVAEGTSIEDALMALNADLRQRHEQATATPGKATGDKALAAATPDTSEGERLAAMEDGEEKWKLEWLQDKAVRAAFGNNEKRWLAYQRNKHKTRYFAKGQKQD